MKEFKTFELEKCPIAKRDIFRVQHILLQGVGVQWAIRHQPPVIFLVLKKCTGEKESRLFSKCIGLYGSLFYASVHSMHTSSCYVKEIVVLYRSTHVL